MSDIDNINGESEQLNAEPPGGEDIAEGAEASAEMPEDDKGEALADAPAAEENEALPEGRFARTLFRVYKNEPLYEALRIISYAVAVAAAYAFFFTLAELIGAGGYLDAAMLAVGAAVPFVIVTVLRRVINAPRPYEVFDFYKAPPKNKAGQSFPSRHVFSCFVIATLIMPENLLLGILIALSGVLLAAVRVLMGLHFVRDTVAGSAIGIISGVIIHLIALI